ncbi:hypothetical protein Scep_029314 [Stephania cephalantha]|uniref:Uncharacterized protein n=1 Tax=Stephania cephalantha TaxID=152367 RepID=A0AAP0HC41_9MAGN
MQTIFKVKENNKDTVKGGIRYLEAKQALLLAYSQAICFFQTGYNKSIRVFDLHRPGRDFEQYSTIQGNKEGQ